MALLAGLGHALAVDSTVGVFVLLNSLITMLAFILGLFALVRYFGNRGTLFLYGGIGFLGAGTLELLRLLIFTTGFVVTQREGAIVYEEFLLWSGTVVNTWLAAIMLVAMRDTFVHWLVVALIFAAGAALFLFPFIALLTDSYNLMAQFFKLAASLWW